MRKRKRTFLLKRRNEKLIFKKIKNKINPRITLVVTPGTEHSSISVTKNQKNKKFYSFASVEPVKQVLLPPGGLSRNCDHITDKYYESNRKFFLGQDNGTFYSLGEFRKELPITFYRWQSNDSQRCYRIAYRQNAVSMGLQGLLYNSGRRRKKSQAFLLNFLLTIFGPIRSILRLLRRYLKSPDRKVRSRLIRRMLGHYNGNTTIISNFKIALIHRKLQDVTYYLKNSTGNGSSDPMLGEDVSKVWKSRRSRKSLKGKFFKNYVPTRYSRRAKTHVPLSGSQVKGSSFSSDDEIVFIDQTDEESLWE